MTATTKTPDQDYGYPPEKQEEPTIASVAPSTAAILTDGKIIECDDPEDD